MAHVRSKRKKGRAITGAAPPARLDKRRRGGRLTAAERHDLPTASARSEIAALLSRLSAEARVEALTEALREIAAMSESNGRPVPDEKAIAASWAESRRMADARGRDGYMNGDPWSGTR